MGNIAIKGHPTRGKEVIEILEMLGAKNKYNLTGEDLYISTSKDQKLTAEQKNLVLGNIGIYHQTLTDLQNAELQNGIAYVIETNTLYIIKDGVISSSASGLTLFDTICYI